jgi:hypothetical protein
MFRRHHLLALCACSSLLLLAACGDDDDDDTVSGTDGTTTTAVTQAGQTPTGENSSSAEPTLSGPASKYTLLLVDVGNGYFTDRQHTFELSPDNYSGTAAFPSADEGKRLLGEWGYAGGFETAYEPEARQSDVLRGKFYVAVETHLFESPAGAKAAYSYFEEGLRAARKAEFVQTATVGNESSGWKYTDAKISGSSVSGVFHRYLIRRGNMIAVVQTWGAEPLMSVDTVRGLAAILDQKAMGLKDAPEPTATPVP